MAKNRSCYLCRGRRLERVEGRVRDRPALKILRCRSCRLVFLDSFDHISDGYYSQDYTRESHSAHDWKAKLAKCRADDLRRAREISRLVAGRRYLDVGCGAGGVLLNLRGRCRAAAGVEMQDSWRVKLNGAGILTARSIEELPVGRYDVISLFHVLEHIKDPLPFLRSLRARLPPRGRLVVEVPNADDALLSLYECGPFSRYTYWSPHLYLHTKATLGRLLVKAGLRPLAIRHIQRYPLANHLMWLSKGRPGGHEEWPFLRSDALDAAYAERLSAIGRTDTLLAFAAPA